uniref:Homeobox domain-containing protein n=1 Tax=Oryzias sinensis TaxID=183150 RepID=A0A8C7ZWA7_9TELE
MRARERKGEVRFISDGTLAAVGNPGDGGFLSHSSSRRPRTHLSCLQLSILQSCYETCAHPNAMECEAIGSELNLPLKVVQIWFQNTRAKEKRWRLSGLPNPGPPDLPACLFPSSPCTSCCSLTESGVLSQSEHKHLNQGSFGTSRELYMLMICQKYCKNV